MSTNKLVIYLPISYHIEIWKTCFSELGGQIFVLLNWTDQNVVLCQPNPKRYYAYHVPTFVLVKIIGLLHRSIPRKTILDSSPKTPMLKVCIRTCGWGVVCLRRTLNHYVYLKQTFEFDLRNRKLDYWARLVTNMSFSDSLIYFHIILM